MNNDHSGTPARFARRPTASPNPDFFPPAILEIKKAFRLPYLYCIKLSKFWILIILIDNSTMVKSVKTKEYAQFVERLREARLDAGLSQAQVAKKLKRPQSHISNIESGQQRVDVVELGRFAKMYGKDINYFVK